MLGIGSAALTLAAALTALVLRTALGQAVSLYLAAVLSLLHSWVTTRAAPIMFSQRQLGADPAALTALFECFARWQALRAILQGCAFAALLWALTYARVM